jgi:hypothetical protein
MRQQVVGRREQHHADDREQQQRVDLGVLEAGVEPALGLGAGQRGGLAGERRDPALELPLGEEQHAAEREEQDQPHRKTLGPSTTTVPIEPTMPRRAVAVLVQRRRPDDGRQGAGQPPMAQRSCTR